MPYYPTIEEDLKRAKEILAKGIYGADIYAAYKLLESFVVEIEDVRRSFALYHTASMALMHAYKATHPEVPENVWPDATQVNVWAAAEIERLKHETASDLGRRGGLKGGLATNAKLTPAERSAKASHAARIRWKK